MHCRRLTRLTYGFSKKLENFEAAVALNFAYYHFYKTDGALRCTPVQAAGLEASHGRSQSLLSVVGNKTEYIQRLQMISHLHGCDSTWIKTVPVVETFQGQTVWDGDVEVFRVNHAKTDTAYAWAASEGKFTAVLGVPPATDPRNAVKISIVADAKRGE
jgi:hypothetical protein